MRASKMTSMISTLLTLKLKMTEPIHRKNQNRSLIKMPLLSEKSIVPVKIFNLMFSQFEVVETKIRLIK